MILGSRIVRELGYLPLAIEQAAAYIREVTQDLHLLSAKPQSITKMGTEGE
jgi:hypothetical protein